MSASEKVTFAELGMPFRLFAAPVDCASDYSGMGLCSLCQRDGQHRFELGIGCYVRRECASCRTENYLDADGRKDDPCRSCGAVVTFPASREGKVYACFDCLRQGNAAITQDTEFGMITWEQALEGVTHGVPGLERDGYELVSLEDNEEWRGVRLPSEMMWELLRTPTYSTIQGERWQFCCHQPMTYVGEWEGADFERNAPNGDGRAFMEEVVQDFRPGLWDGRMHDSFTIYVFHCPECGRYVAHWDMF